MKNKAFFAILFLAIVQVPAFAQSKGVTLSGRVQAAQSKVAMAYVNVLLKSEVDSSFVAGTITDEAGLFSFSGLKKGNYSFEASYIGYQTYYQPVLIGQLSDFLDMGTVLLSESSQTLEAVTVTAKQDEIAAKMDKKSYNLAENINQSGGSVLQAMSNLPSVTVSQEGKVQLRGSDKVTVLVDGKQMALTGFDSQKGLDNIPASAIERIEIINNPSAKYDANGNAGIINIIFKKEKKEGFNGQLGMAAAEVFMKPVVPVK